MGFFELIVLLVILFVVIAMLRGGGSSGKRPVIFSHWYHLLQQLNDSSQRFYEALAQAIQGRSLPDVEISRVVHHEGGVFSAKREYLRVERNEHVFDICAAPFGNGFFISWWLGEMPSAFWEFIAKIPILGPMLFNSFRPNTYYRLDTTLMFQESIHSAVLEVLDEITKGKGFRSLSELERKPILKQLFDK